MKKTKLPIIVFNFNQLKLYPDALNDLKKRCYFVPSKVSEENRYVFCEESLKKGLKDNSLRKSRPSAPELRYLIGAGKTNL